LEARPHNPDAHDLVAQIAKKIHIPSRRHHAKGGANAPPPEQTTPQLPLPLAQVIHQSEMVSIVPSTSLAAGVKPMTPAEQRHAEWV
jgi:hypothetical protein